MNFSKNYFLKCGTGLEISQGNVVSPQDSDDYTASLLFTINNEATFFATNWPPNPTTNVYTAVTGPYAILVSNVNVGSNYIGNFNQIHGVNPRTALCSAFTSAEIVFAWLSTRDAMSR